MRPFVRQSRKAVNETVSVDRKGKKVKKYGVNMEKEKDLEEKVEEKIEEKGENGETKEADTKTDEAPVNEKPAEEEQAQEEPAEENADGEIVEETSQVAEIGIDVNDLVTKSMLAERFAALEAKFDAVLKENEDLKNKLDEQNNEINGMKDKYENKDFGDIGSKNSVKSKESKVESYDDYARKFM